MFRVVIACFLATIFLKIEATKLKQTDKPILPHDVDELLGHQDRGNFKRNIFLFLLPSIFSSFALLVSFSFVFIDKRSHVRNCCLSFPHHLSVNGQQLDITVTC